MNFFAIGDLHLGLGIDKKMDVFGALWQNHHKKLKEAWTRLVGDDDFVLIPGDLSWAMNFQEAKADIDFLGKLPGTKIIIRGNHDYWWRTLKKMKDFLPSSIIPLHNNAFSINKIGIAGTRLWIDPDLHLETSSTEDNKIFERELNRLRLSLNSLPPNLDRIIIMTHFPPISLDGKTGRAIEITEDYKCDIWAFGHMHLNGKDYSAFNRKIGHTKYEFVSADYLGFKPKLILEKE